MDNVTKLSKYCTLCGNCLAVCPANALKIQRDSICSNDSCISCGACINHCPGYGFSYPAFNKSIFRKNLKRSSYIGFYQLLKNAKSTARPEKASSGGIVTGLLLGAFDKKAIDGAVVTTLDGNLKSVGTVAETRQDIIKASGSKYCIVPLTHLIKKFKKNKRYAFVGLPCHIQGIRLLQRNNHSQAKQIKFCIGLFCGRTMHSEATDYILHKLHCDRSSAQNLNYRGGAWPGGFSAKTRDKEYFLHKYYYDFFNLIFNPKRCLVCPDYTSEFADISIGDCWIKGREGYSTVVMRTANGKKLYSDIRKSVVDEDVDLSDILKTHPNFRYKQGAFLRGKWLDIYPKYDAYSQQCSYIRTKIFYLIIRLLMTSFAKKTIKVFPLGFMGFFVHLRRWLV